MGRGVQNILHGMEDTVAAERKTFAPEAQRQRELALVKEVDERIEKVVPVELKRKERHRGQGQLGQG